MKAVMFDLDGTLLNTLQDLGISMNVALKALGCPEHPLEDYRELIGGGIRHFCLLSLPKDKKEERWVDECVQHFSEYYQKHWALHTSLYPGIANLLSTLQTKKVPMAILSNKPDHFTQEMVKHYLSSWYFEAVSGAIEDKPHKPDPTLALELVQDLGVNASDVYYIGDTSVDILTAKNAGFCPIGVQWGFRLEKELLEAGAAHILKDPLDLLSLI